ncbi:MAG: diacylglycerol kinase [Gemmataceae bacterium]
MRRRSRRSWRAKLGEAFRGVKLGVRRESNFFVHIFVGALVVVSAVVLRCGLTEWCLLLGCIGVVLVAELFNSSIETLFHALDPGTQGRMIGCLDIAAGAVLVASMVAAVVGVLIFGNRLFDIVSH